MVTVTGTKACRVGRGAQLNSPITVRSEGHHHPEALGVDVICPASQGQALQVRLTRAAWLCRWAPRSPRQVASGLPVKGEAPQSLLGLVLSIGETICVKCPKQHPACRKCSINKSYPVTTLISLALPLSLKPSFRIDKSQQKRPPGSRPPPLLRILKCTHGASENNAGALSLSHA